jgi:hypothetical protein
MEKSEKPKEKKSGNEKPLSLYPLSFEEAVKKLVKKPPGKEKRPKKG